MKPLNGEASTCGPDALGVSTASHFKSAVGSISVYDLLSGPFDYYHHERSGMSTANGNTSGNGFPQQVANGLASTASGLAKVATTTADGAKERIQIIDEKKDFTYVLSYCVLVYTEGELFAAQTLHPR